VEQHSPYHIKQINKPQAYYFAKPINITVIQIYAPTSNSGDEKIEQFFHEVCTAIEDAPKKDIQRKTYWNATMGTDTHEEYLGTVGKFGWGSTNKLGTRMLEFAR